MSQPSVFDTPVSPRQNHDEYHDALKRATDAIAPVWPLDQWIAVNPWWGLKNQPIEQVSHALSRMAGQPMTMPAEFYRKAWETGRITPQDLQEALFQGGYADSEQSLVGYLASPPSPVTPLRSAWEMMEGHTGFDPLAESCASYFDQHQQRWANRSAPSLYHFWKTTAQHDLRWPKTQRKALQALPNNATAAIEQIAADWALAPDVFEVLAHTLLLRVNGWAAWCQGIGWHTPHQQEEAGITQLAAIVLAWEWLGVAQLTSTQQSEWRAQWQTVDAAVPPQHKALWCWQHAFELGYQRELADVLAAPSQSPPSAPEVMAAFCIDVRSERFRRHLEHAAPTVTTLGVAGFFAMPVADAVIGPERAQPRVPGLLKPRYRVGFPQPQQQGVQRYQKESLRQSVRHAKYAPLSTFTLVETTGIAWGWKLIKDSLRKQAPMASCDAPAGLFHTYGGEPIARQEKVALAKSLLTLLGTPTASLLVLVGHDSQSDNNPHHAGLACGACGGQGGGMNARVAAALLNDSDVQQAVIKAGVSLPSPFYVLAATHCTLTDRVHVYRDEKMPKALETALLSFESAAQNAGNTTRQERAPALGVNASDHTKRLKTLAMRGADWSQPRPEWGLVNNAALILAPRALTQGKSLEGRAFLHDYHPAQDPDGKILEGLMMAPMLVASWINLQYYASTVVPKLYGAGNKLLHSVVGGHMGVIEGNSPQLRIGLPEQSLRDGDKLHHEPLRLTVVIDAPKERIETIIARQPVVADLINHRWLWLTRMGDKGLERYSPEGWQPIAAV
ncbi:Na-translocating system protein MpsB [Halomonas vilamensis]|uniref:Probable inorganic carbon transporter subunit DabA n=1 Tax=Vreelandella vilamensis TaxID=531309 RepID=A0ABU1H2J7_9GAMM|nr:putative inorganic carbon transporter subunit DabA [Halomonas vilamensis]MDR5898503.1 Na-translocating system protein MpsB [Halomonas vilamensis]